MQTTSILPLLITTPLGAILSGTFVNCLVKMPKKVANETKKEEEETKKPEEDSKSSNDEKKD